MNIGLRVILIGVAALLFILAVFLEDNYADLLALGLAALAIGLIIDEVGIGTRRIGVDRD
jgi:hypothetical protein